MTHDEAFAHLNIDHADDAADGFETVLFETKQFLLSKPVFLKTFAGRIAKLGKQYEAFLTLGGKPAGETVPPSPGMASAETVTDHLLAYHAAKNQIRRSLSSTNSFTALKTLTEQLIDLERVFAEPFAAYPDWTDAPVQIGKEPDVMEVLALLKEQASKSRVTLAQLQSTKNDLPHELLLVLKRLSLLKNYLYE
jgi:hypothetical protein